MRNFLTHANPEWRGQRSTSARIQDPKNQDKMKRRRARVVHANWDSLMVKWSTTQRWWETSKGWESLVKTAEEVCEKELEERVGQGGKGSYQGFQNEGEMETRLEKMKEKREAKELWSCVDDQNRYQILVDSNLIVNWMNGKWKINNQRFRKMIQRTQNMLDKTDSRPMVGHLRHVPACLQRMETGGWPFDAGGKGNSDHMQLLCDGERSPGWVCEKFVWRWSECWVYCSNQKWSGVSLWDSKCWENWGKHRENAGWNQCGSDINYSEWFNSNVTQADCTGAVEAARAICCLAQTGCICFDLDEHWSKTTTKTRQDKETEWKKTPKVDGRGKRTLRLSNSSSTISSVWHSFELWWRDFASSRLVILALRRWIRGIAGWVLNPSGVLMLIGQLWVAMNPLRLFHRGEISHSGGSRLQRRSKDCQNQDAESKQQYEALLKKHAFRVHNVDERLWRDEGYEEWRIRGKRKGWKKMIEEDVFCHERVDGENK